MTEMNKMTVVGPQQTSGEQLGEGGPIHGDLPEPQDLRSVLAKAQIGRFWGIFAFAAMFLIFSLWVPNTFLTSTTWQTIAESQAITAIIALAILAPLAAGVFDLSVAQNMGFSALVCGALIANRPHLGVVSAILITLAVGASIGAFNGVLVGVMGLDSFMATLGSSSLLVGGSAIIAHGSYFGPFPTGFTDITAGSVLGVPILAVYMVIVAFVAWYALEHTPLGRRVFATGANRDAARLAGIRTKRLTFWAMVTCGLIASLAGALLASNLNAVNETLGPQYLLPAYAAAFLGTTQFKLGRFNVWGTILAVFIIGVGIQGLQLGGANIWVTNIFSGAALILAVSFRLLLGRRRKAKEVQAAEEAG